MQTALREHIPSLEAKIITLRKELRDANLAGPQRREREFDLANAEEALKLFRKAHELEQRITS